MKDYSIKLRDVHNKTCIIHINAACIIEQIKTGVNEHIAVENVERNALENAIARGDIDENCWEESAEAGK